MAECIDDYCEDPLGEHTENLCDGFVYGGLPAVVLFKCAPDNPSDGAEVQEMIDAGTAWYWGGLLAGIPAASPVDTEAQRSCGDSIVSRIDRTLTVSDSNISSGNIDWFNGARRKTFAAALAFNCSTGKSLYIVPASSIRLRGSATFPNQNNDTAKFVGELYWNNIDDPNLITSPDGIFDGARN